MLTSFNNGTEKAVPTIEDLLISLTSKPKPGELTGDTCDSMWPGCCCCCCFL